MQTENSPAATQVEEMLLYEYGIMSSKRSLKAADKLTAYATMLLDYRANPNLIVIYTPETSKDDSWFLSEGEINERIDEIFGGPGSFLQYLEDHVKEIKACFKSIKQVV